MAFPSGLDRTVQPGYGTAPLADAARMGETSSEQCRPWGVAECYNLFATYLASKDYLKAAAAAYEMYTSLCRPFDGSVTGDPATTVPEMEYSRSGCLAALASGGNTSKVWNIPQIAPRPHSLTSHVRALQRAQPVLESIRNSLLMLISALSMASDKLIVVPQAKFNPSAGDDTMAGAGEEEIGLESLRMFFDKQAQSSVAQSVFTLRDGERLLAIVEAKLTGVASGDSQPSPQALACRAAEQGLLAISLELAQHFSLDMWQVSFQPFTRLCLDLEHTMSRAKLEEVVAAARGANLWYMFVQSDAQEPLLQTHEEHRGVDRRVVALWAMLEEGLRAGGGPAADSGDQGSSAPAPSDAESFRLYSLVADEIVAHEVHTANIHGSTGRGLPGFVATVLSTEKGWPLLLQVYMKYSRWEAAVELTVERVQEVETAVRTQRVQSPGMDPHLHVRNFPLYHVLKLQRYLEEASSKEDTESEQLRQLNSSLADFKRLCEELDGN